jgi:aminopeptidase-like protein
VRQGDLVFCQAAALTDSSSQKELLAALLDALGPGGTLAAPAYTRSFITSEVFDPASSPSTCGGFSEMVRRQPQAHRSSDPLYSVALLGARSRELTPNETPYSLGQGSFWQRLSDSDGLIVGLEDWLVRPLIHHLEWRLAVSYRFDKLFTGWVIRQGCKEKGGVVCSCRDLSDPDSRPEMKPLVSAAQKRGLVTEVDSPLGKIKAIRSSVLAGLVEELINANPLALTQGGRGKRGPSPTAGSQKQDLHATLPEKASARQIIDSLWALPRDIVSPGYDAALYALTGQLPLQMHSYPTGSHCWSWIVPEQWQCTEAWLAAASGDRLFSYQDNPLHVVSYSLPFAGEVTREELFKHLHTHPRLPQAVPFVFKYYERDWGLCCSRLTKDSLQDPRYRVNIRTRFSRGELKVGEAVVQGQSPDCFVLCAHLCHPRAANDGLSGVAVGVEVMRALMQKPKPRYTYRLLILPETIGSVAWLSHHEKLIPRLKGGLFLEMLGLDNPHALQLSFGGDTGLDRLLTQILRQCDPGGWTGPFRRVVANDERQFNAPGVRVPMLSLSRVLPLQHPDRPYAEYHSDQDTPDLCSPSRLQESVELVLAMINALEAEDLEQLRTGPQPQTGSGPVPVNKFKGEVFCSRYGLHADFFSDPSGHQVLFDVMFLIDGTRSIEQIASQCQVEQSTVQNILDRMARYGLVTYPDSLP